MQVRLKISDLTSIIMKQFNVILERANAIFNPGESVSGQVHIQVLKPEKTKGILIEFTGTARIFISKEVSKKIGVKREEHKWHLSRMEEENIVDQYLYLYGDDSGKLLELPVGLHQFPFEFKLPRMCPATYYGHSASIKYSLLAINKLEEEEVCEQLIVLLGILDLNRYPDTHKVTNVLEIKHMKRLCCKAGYIGFKMSIERSGYIPGETLKLLGEVYNYGYRTHFDFFSVELVQICICTAHDTSDTTFVKILTFEEGSTFCPPEPGEYSPWSGSIVLPNLPPNNLGGGDRLKKISLSYKISFHLKFQRNGGTSEVEVYGDMPNIMIGTIALKKSRSAVTYTEYKPEGMHH